MFIESHSICSPISAKVLNSFTIYIYIGYGEDALGVAFTIYIYIGYGEDALGVEQGGEMGEGGASIRRG